MSEVAKIIACGPAGFAGAGRVMCNWLRATANAGADCCYVGPQVPFPWRRAGSGPVETVWQRKPTTSAAIGPAAAVPSAGALLPFELAEEIQRALTTRGSTASVIWAHYLYPYGLAALLAARDHRLRGGQCRLWLTPAGSDIWELGPQLPLVTEGTLSCPDVDRIITYSDGFADEIKVRYGAHLAIDVVRPTVEPRFSPVSSWHRDSLRSRLGLSPSDFVISSHSNMRPIKAPEDVLSVARRIASLASERSVCLVLAGPKIDLVPYSTPLRVVQTGVIEDVHELVSVADVEINLSRHDSFNLSIAEAMACGVPAVTTDVAGVSKHVSASGGGFTVAVETPREAHPRRRYDSAVGTILRLMGDEPWRAWVGLEAGRYAGEAFRSDFAGNHFVAWLRDAAAGVKQSRPNTARGPHA